MVAYYLHLRKQSPQQGEYNPLQKMAYTSVFVILTPLILLSGMAMSPQLDVAFHWLPALFGGRQSARAFHFILAFGFLSFVFGHVFMVLTQGVFNNMRSMTTGWYREKALPEAEPAHAPVEPVAAIEQEAAPAVIGESTMLAKQAVEPTEAAAPVSSSETPSVALPAVEKGENKDEDQS